MTIEAFWAKFCAANGTSGLLPAITRFGDSPALQDELCDLVLVGRKRATASLALWYGQDREGAPRCGDLAIMLDGTGTPRAILQTTDVREGRFDTVDAQFAADEGEGDGSLDDWIGEHRRFFGREMAAEGLVFSEAVPVIFERFRLLWQP